MGSAGMDANTGKILTNWDHVVQSVRMIWRTQIGSRIMRRSYGGAAAGILGRRLIMQTIALYRLLTILSLERWEPRIRVKRLTITADVDAARAGEITATVSVDYMPNGHKGDTTVASTRDVSV